MNQDVFDQCNEANEQIKTKVDGENGKAGLNMLSEGVVGVVGV